MSSRANNLREGEVTGMLPSKFDAGLYFIGQIHTPWRERTACPRRGDPLSGPICRIELFDPWTKALEGIDHHDHLDILYWMNEARRDLLLQAPRHAERALGTFALRSPVRPNPIALSRVKLIAVGENWLEVRGLDCIDKTPLVDIKPEQCPNAGDEQHIKDSVCSNA
jgi:tRNA-Thr(GGU) m(6)t(6)A37 methyltransferase TsaA